MARIKNKKINEAIESGIRSKLLKEIKKINSYDQINDFFNKFMTADEKTLFLRRFAVINLLEQGMKYRDIENILEISSATISSVRDVVAGRGYNRHLDRKKKSLIFYKVKKPARRYGLRYKGTSGLLDPFS